MEYMSDSIVDIVAQNTYLERAILLMDAVVTSYEKKPQDECPAASVVTPE